jgi:5'-methylthioadenosine phosphorylase
MSIDYPKDVKIGIIGGTGSDVTLENPKEYKVYTPYGDTSDLIAVGMFRGKKVAFMPRHGKGHRIPPHNLPNRANLWAMKQLGVQRVISPSAVGSLQPEHDKGDFVLVTQYIDRTKIRPSTFYDGGQVCHISQADPFCSELNDIFFKAGKEISGLKIKPSGTYVCIEGPRFSTRAESKAYRMWGGDIIGMTCYPEVVLAAELGMCYNTVAMVTDLDVWAAQCKKCKKVLNFGEKCPTCQQMPEPMAVSIEEILETMEHNATHLKNLLEKAIPRIPDTPKCQCPHSLEGAII